MSKQYKKILELKKRCLQMLRFKTPGRGENCDAENKSDAKDEAHYFVKAKNWRDATLARNESARHHWRYLCLYVLIPLTLGLVGSLLLLLARPRLFPMIIHHYANGRVFVLPIKQGEVPMVRSQMESELVRYVMNRESYCMETYQQQYRLVHLLSSQGVAKQYSHEQKANHPTSPIHALDRRGRRSVQIVSVIFLKGADVSRVRRRKLRQNYVAEVSFTLSDYDSQGMLLRKQPLTALIAWHYGSTSRDPENRWRN